MAIRITEECVACGACEDECPNTAISLGDSVFVIDPKLCTECVGFHDLPSCQDACPIDCCLPDPRHVESEDQLFDRARRLHPELADGLELTEENSHFRSPIPLVTG